MNLKRGFAVVFKYNIDFCNMTNRNLIRYINKSQNKKVAINDLKVPFIQNCIKLYRN